MMEYATTVEHKQDAAAFHDALAEAVVPKVIRLTLKGPVPNKKNLWKPKPNGRGMYIDSEIKSLIDSLIIQAKLQWSRPPIEHPDVDVEFFVRDRKSDRDNKLGCILDVLQKAGVLVNDNSAHFNGTVVIHPAVIGNVEGVVIDIAEQQMVLA